VVTVQYELPPTLSQENYQLIVQRQAGSQPLPLTLRIAGEPWSAMLAEGMLNWSP
jgi:hypothetical protein